MNRELVASALKSASGNKLDFQVALQDSQLHIHVSHQPQHRVNYFLLKDNVTSTVANLYSGDFEIWLYSYLAGETKPEWQTLIKKIPVTDLNEDDTVGRGQNFNNCSDTSLILNTDDFAEDEISDTGLLLDTGMVHARALSEFELSDTFESQTVLQIVNFNLEDNILAQYCFVTDKEILTGNKIPKREVKRLVICFHHLDLEAKYKLLPILDSYFQGDRINVELPVALQRWFEQIKKLEPRDRQLLAIWLTRYCLSPRTTLEEFEAAKDVVFVQSDKLKRQGECPTTSDASASHASLRTTEESSTSAKQLDKSNRRSKLFFLKFMLSSIFIIVTAVLIILRISRNIVPAKHIPAFCNSTIGSLDYCRLAVDLVGEKKITRASKNLFPLTKVTEAVATHSCEKYANLKAGLTTDLADKTPVISSYGEKIFPHIYVVEVRQKNKQQTGNIRVGCVYTNGKTQRSPKLLAADVIPDNSSNSQQLY